ncbi:MAG: class I SAM-dependent methyltransferase [Pseudomonadota bacterium]
MTSLYDTIGLNYADLRKPDRRIAEKIDAALGTAIKVLNVGAGTGSYEAETRQITAVEPSMEMIRQRGPSDTTVIQASAENLPFGDNSFDAVMAILTVHHWSDQERGIHEMLRVTRDQVVILTFDPFADWFWLTDYVPALAELDRWQMPQIKQFEAWFNEIDVSVMPIPGDCSDGFLAAYWKRPEAYLDDRVRSAMSSFSAIGDSSEGLARLAADLESGAWQRRYGHLLDLEDLDCGYRLVVGR